ncbi:MAG: hypothetical protein JWQ21_570 [Herminiimonas sp.]|nr:hypothetical protein [Herminiimonas sp.]
MIPGNLQWKTFIIGCLFAGLTSESFAIDSVSLELGSGNRTQFVRAGAQWNWDSQWWKSNGTHVGGYWDLSLAEWHGNRFQNRQGAAQNITALGITPVFRLQKDTTLGFYGEAGIGLYYLSDLYNNNDRRLSTNIEFGTLLGAGYVFRNNLELGLKIQHFSNGGIKKPNDGVNFAIVRASYRF